MRIKELFAEAATLENETVQISGWLRNVRHMKGLTFLALSDGSTQQHLQVVCNADLVNYDAVSHLHIGGSVAITGRVVLTPEAQQPLECQATEVRIIADAPSDYPLQKKRHSFEYLRTQAHLRPRTNTFSAVFRLRSVMQFAIHRFFNDRGFVCLHPPILTATDAEGAGEMFQVTTLDLDAPSRKADGSIAYTDDFFAQKAHLTVSGQLNAEAFAMAFRDVYTFSPTFRAEDSNTARHAAEFWMVEPEIAFADLDDLIDLATAFIRTLIQDALRELPEEMAFFDQFIEKGLLARLDRVANGAFERMTYTEAIDVLTKSGKTFDFPVSWGMDLQTEHERFLTDDVIKGPVFVTDYPKDIKAFYMRMNDDNRTVAAMDLLVPGIGEIIGGSQREERIAELQNRMTELQMEAEAYAWYFDLRRYGGTPHAGFGLGFERLLMYLSGMKNIRDVIAFPRVPGQIGF